jgi:cytidine deaminase
MTHLETGRLLRAAADVAGNAHAPYSRYRVGAALLAEGGEIYCGCNVENASYGLTVCAERTAVFTGVAAGHRHFEAVAVVAAGEQMPYPCGACRQVLSEFCDPETPVLVARAEFLDAFEALTLGDLLPHSFEM